MNETLYVTGTTGFKLALMTRLGSDRVHRTEDIGDDIISFTLPENASLEDLKVAIGDDIISEHDIHFFDEMPEGHTPYTAPSFVAGRPFKMSIWVNRDSRLAENRSMHVAEENEKQIVL